MTFTLKRILAAAMAVWLSACATAPDSAPAEATQRIKRVAVVSTIGDVFHRVYVGATVFGNEAHDLKIADWHLDRAYEQQIATALRERGGYTLVEAPYAADEFAKVNLSGKYEVDWDAATSAVKSYCAANGLEGVFVLAKAGSAGVGVFAQGYGPNKGASLYVSGHLALFDCATDKMVVARRLVDPYKPARGLFAPKPSPFMPLPEGWPWDGEWEPTVYQQARAALEKLPLEAWARLLDEMLRGR